MNLFIINILCAFVSGALIGLERQFKQRNAGLRTNTLVSVGSAAFVLLSVSLTGNTGDPSRIAAQIVSGIGFLGGGLILKDGLNVKGLNSAATIWCSAACGTLAGVGLYNEVFIVALLVVVIHLCFSPLGRYINKLATNTEYYTIKVDCNSELMDKSKSIIMHAISLDKEVKLESFYYKENDKNIITLICELKSEGERVSLLDVIASRLRFEYGISHAGWEIRNNERVNYV